MFDYFYGQSGEMFSYFRVPKILFRDIKFKDLSTDAKTLYGILLDRMSLSVKNGWLDGQGRVYIIFLYRRLWMRLAVPITRQRSSSVSWKTPDLLNGNAGAWESRTSSTSKTLQTNDTAIVIRTIPVTLIPGNRMRQNNEEIRLSGIILK